MAYKALVTRIFTRPLPGSDNIVLGKVGGYQVIVNKDTEDGQLGVFFEQGGQLSEEFARENDLVRRKLPDGSSAGGFFEENRRVKALKLRGARSEGFWCPLTHLAYTGYDLEQLREGDEFDALNGHPICNKYVTRATRAARRAGSRSSNRAETPMFPRHIETEALRRGVGQIPEGAVIYITEKVHGTSFRYGCVLEEEPLKLGFLESLYRKLTRKGPRMIRYWRHLNGSRNVILERRAAGETGFYGGEDFRFRATHGLALRKGEVIYGELAGYTDTGAPIMAPQSLTNLKDKTAQRQFGDEVIYTYGAIPGQCVLYVYRIIMVNEDGDSVELSWPQVVDRCRELGLKTVPQVAEPFVYRGDAEALLAGVSALVDGENGAVIPSGIDPRHPQEGVVVRYESSFGTGFLKHKSFAFGVLEGYLKERDDYVDTEEAA